jgi:pyruvate formate lyase activating enzyme
MKHATYYEEVYRYQLRCNLCPHNCMIGDGKTGICHVRRNIKGELFLETYGMVSSMGLDPIEKKPFYHFYPGQLIFSIGSYGCNLSCKFCQNHEISQCVPSNMQKQKIYSPAEIVELAGRKRSSIGIAYTYNEPVVWFEYLMDIAELSGLNGFKNVMVTNGFINSRPLENLLEVIDAFNVDLKGFTEDFYLTQTMSKLDPVKQNLLQIRKAGKHLEITHLLVTGKNDDVKDFTNMVKWINDELGADTILHLSRYFPNYKMFEPPTSPQMLSLFYDIAKQYLKYVYIGNLASAEGQNTFCPACNRKVIERNRYMTKITGLTKEGNCKNCNHHILDYLK